MPPGRTSSAARPTPCSPHPTGSGPATPIERHLMRAPPSPRHFIVAAGRLLSACGMGAAPPLGHTGLQRSRHPYRPPRARATTAETQACRWPKPFLELHTGPGAATRCSSWWNATSGWWNCATPTGTACAPKGARWAGCHRGSCSPARSPPPARRKAFRDVLVDDFLNRRLEKPAAPGRFKGDPCSSCGCTTGWPTRWAAELHLGQVQGVFSGTEFWSLSLTSEPWSDRAWSPFSVRRRGQFRNIPNTSLVDAAPRTPSWPRHAGPALAHHAAASRRGWTGRCTPPSWPTSAAPNTAPSAAGLAFFF
jgi:hypothetical protein